jgi:hypothetical protein
MTKIKGSRIAKWMFKLYKKTRYSANQYTAQDYAKGENE